MSVAYSLSQAEWLLGCGPRASPLIFLCQVGPGLGPEHRSLIWGQEEYRQPFLLYHLLYRSFQADPVVPTKAYGDLPFLGSGHIKEVIVAADTEPGDAEMAEAPVSPNHHGIELAVEGEQAQAKLLVNKDGRYVCMLCHKTFKTVSPWGQGLPGLLPSPILGGAPSLTALPLQGSILKAHMVTHSSRKDHECKLCGASFRTKGSLIRHHRRHTGELLHLSQPCGCPIPGLCKEAGPCGCLPFVIGSHRLLSTES